MLKSALRMTKFPVLTGSVSTDGRLTSLFAYLNITSRNICTTSLCSKEIRLQNEKVKVGKGSKYGLVEGETTMETLNINQQAHLFPDEDTPNRLFDANGKVLLLHTAGIEGFKNAKKGTNIAGQQAAITLGNRIREYGINTVRIKVQGIGPGRMSSIKGLQMAGLNIISITDATRVSWHPPRPRKRRRV
ncbi:unnamed protein product [Lasius platythorax]|uniref:30S ribosomal protein S11, chloroplastic n=1 Tax=Lasius platythorax TaxID=488582 RepID=A0AAV2P639_9HYME